MCQIFPITVSIITPLHNAEAYIAKTIDSVIAQSFDDWEMIIVDDMSTDRSCEVVTTYCQKDNRVRLIRLTENSGAAVARNTAVTAARGRYIAFLDSDDLWKTEKLNQQIRFMQEHDYPFSFSAYERINEEDEVVGFVGVPDRVSYQQMLKTSVIGCLTAIYDTVYFGKVSIPLIRKRQDYALWLKLLKETEFAYGIKEPLAFYRVRADSISSNKLNTSTFNWRVYRDIEKLSFISSCYYFCHYAFRGVLRSKFPSLAKKLQVMDN